jgi:methenyltetrahydrofolate cyclohydrolase
MLADRPFRDVVAALASADPTPGGGSASAAAAAMGAALLTMVASLPKTRHASDEDRVALEAARLALTPIQRGLVEAVDADQAAYDSVIAAYRQPKASEAERAERTAAIARALRAATDVPLRVMRLSASALKAAGDVAAHGHRPAASDAAVAITLLRAGLEGARLNVATNIEGLADADYAGAVRDESRRLGDEAEAAARAADGLLGVGRVG